MKNTKQSLTSYLFSCDEWFWVNYIQYFTNLNWSHPLRIPILSYTFWGDVAILTQMIGRPRLLVELPRPARWANVPVSHHRRLSPQVTPEAEVYRSWRWWLTMTTRGNNRDIYLLLLGQVKFWLSAKVLLNSDLRRQMLRFLSVVFRANFHIS